jgi:hypothetical protein
MDRLRREVYDAASGFRRESTAAVAEFDKQAAAALEDVGKHATKAKEEITARTRLVLVQNETGGTTVVEVSKAEVRTWFGQVPPNVIAIGGADLTQPAFETKVEGKTMGAFSYHFQHALRSADSDADTNGQISWSEAVTWASQKISVGEYGSQRPVIEGKLSNETAFLVAKDSPKKIGKLRAVLIGCSAYPKLPGIQGPGAVENDDEQGILRVLRDTKTRSAAEFLQLAQSATWETLDSSFQGDDFDELAELFKL